MPTVVLHLSRFFLPWAHTPSWPRVVPGPLLDLLNFIKTSAFVNSFAIQSSGRTRYDINTFTAFQISFCRWKDVLFGIGFLCNQMCMAKVLRNCRIGRGQKNLESNRRSRLIQAPFYPSILPEPSYRWEFSEGGEHKARSFSAEGGGVR